jgi:hypothetical protein
MNRRQVVDLLAFLCLSLPLVQGCARNPLDRQAVSGSVAFETKPLDQGLIQFCPVQQHGGLLVGARIVNGRYEIRCDKGLPPGEYVVRISAAVAAPKASPKDQSAHAWSEPLKERIPSKYNLTSGLKVEVKTGTNNVFDFALDGPSAKSR